MLRLQVFAPALLAGVLMASQACAQVQEVVVTGSRMTEYDPVRTPEVTLRKRADNLITKVTVVCDTRDQSQRRDELRATLRNMIREASRDHSIALGVGDEIVEPFDEGLLDRVIVPDAKADTSRAEVIIKTPVSAADTFDAATARIKAYVARTPKVGRTEILITKDWELTLVDPNQYRPSVAQLVAEDAKRMAAMFGEGYGVEVEGLQLPVSWYQAGPLDLALYIPYKLAIAPPRR